MKIKPSLPAGCDAGKQGVRLGASPRCAGHGDLESSLSARAALGTPPHPRRGRWWWLALSAALAAFSPWSYGQILVVEVGGHELLPDTPGQTVVVSVQNNSGNPVQVSSLSLNVQVADGQDSTPAPVITAVDILTQSIFGAANLGQTDITTPRLRHLWSATPDGLPATPLTLEPGSNTRLVTLTLDTTGLTAPASWTLSLANTINGPTEYFGAQGDTLAANITDGTVAVGWASAPEPNAAVAVAAVLALGAVFRRWRRRWRSGQPGALLLSLLLLTKVEGWSQNSSSPPLDPDLTISLPDPNLQQAVRQSLGLMTGDITVGDLSKLTVLTIQSNVVNTLTGLEVATNLQSLNLQFDQLRTLTLPPRLNNLVTLDLSANLLTGLTLPEGLTKLTKLKLDYNQLTSLLLPAGLDNLKELGLADNHLTDFSFLAGQRSLTALNLFGNGLTTLNLPEGLDSLQTLNLGGNRLSDFSFLAGRTSLVTLNLYGNGLGQLDLPAGLDNLEELNLGANRLADFSTLTGYDHLKTLDLSHNQLVRLILPEGLDNLQTLNLSANHLSDFSTLAGHESLRALDLRNNHLTNLILPAGLEGLTSLSLGANRLHDLPFLADFKNLETLDLSDNGLTEVTLPAELTALRKLDLSYNRLRELKVPASLVNLREVILHGNPLTEFLVADSNVNLEATIAQLQNSGVRITRLPASEPLATP